MNDLVKRKLIGLARFIGARDVARRIDFLEEVFLTGSHAALIERRFYDDRLNEAHYDQCFEHGDGDEVIIGLMARALDKPALMDSIKRQISEKNLLNWFRLYHKGKGRSSAVQSSSHARQGELFAA